MTRRYRWKDSGVEVSDSQWDTADEWVSNAYKELMVDAECVEAEVKIAYLYYRKGNGLSPASFLADVETVIPLNVEYDPDEIVTLGGVNAITPEAGEYELQADVAIRNTGRSKLFWLTGSTHVLKGTNRDNEDNHQHIGGRFTADGETSYYLTLQSNQAGTIGRIGTDSEEETYATLVLRKIG
jgi:hypothetical protein